MSTAFLPKDSLVADRALKVQRLVIPFTVTHSATASAVVLASDEPSILFLQSEGVNQISAELTALGDSCSYTQSPDDSDGKMNFLVVVGEQVAKVMQAEVISRSTGVAQPTFINSGTSGLTTLKNIALSMDGTIDFSTTDGDLCLAVEYAVEQGN